MNHMPREMMAALFGGQMPDNKPPLDILPIPKEHILEVLTRLQTLMDADKGVIGKFRARHELWTYIHQILPFTRDKECEIDATVSLCPVINITGNSVQSKVGKKHVINIYPFPAEERYRLFELMDLDGNGPLHSYNLWSFVGRFVPQVAANPHDRWAIQSTDVDINIIEKSEKDEED